MTTTKDLKSVREFYNGKAVFITGATGFMGKVLVEKLLRSCPEIENIFLLIRPKKQQTVDHRLQELLSSPLFEKLRREYPEQILKIVPICGDVTEKELGISKADQNILTELVSVVFHSAATVKFDEALKLSITINMVGTKELLCLCRRMYQLEALIHVSTAYCNCDRKDVDEIIYPLPTGPEEVIALTKNVDSKLIKSITPSLIGDRPNTYTFTKALTEKLLEIECGNLPIAIVRPSIVLSSFREPVAGWVDNLNGPTGIIVAAGKGVFRTMLCHEDKVADLVPVDIVINLMICAAWKTAKCENKNIPVYNCCTGQQNPITWRQFVNLSFKYIRLHPVTNTIWYPGGSCHNYQLLNKVCVTFQHMLPAHFMDLIRRLRGKPPVMVGLQRKLNKAANCLEYFTTQQWHFRDDNVRRLEEELSPEDRETFMFDVKQIDWPSYLEHYILGIRQFIMKESPEMQSAALSRIRKLYWLHRAIQFGMLLIVLRFLLMRCSATRTACFSLLSIVLRLCRLIV